MSITNIVRYYARLEYCKDSKKTAKFTVKASTGYYPPMESLKGKNGLISMYYKRHNSTAPNAPEMNLQSTNGINITGVKQLFVNNVESGFAYGNPYRNRYFKRGKINPFFDYKNDAFLFIIHKPDNSITPDKIEIMVLADSKCLAEGYCKRLLIGGFDEALNHLRKQAT